MPLCPHQVTDAMLMNANFVYPENTPTTKEAYYYRTIFEKFFPKVLFSFVFMTRMECVFPQSSDQASSFYLSKILMYQFLNLQQNAARSTVPGGPSVACSTAKAVEWDAAWSKNLDPSGRAALGVHVAAYEEKLNAKIATALNDSPQEIQVTLEKAAAVVQCNCSPYQFVACLYQEWSSFSKAKGKSYYCLFQLIYFLIVITSRSNPIQITINYTINAKLKLDDLLPSKALIRYANCTS